MEMIPEILCNGIPTEFCMLLKYCLNLDYTDNPNYDYMRTVIRQVFLRDRYVLDFQYDWVVAYSQETIKNKDKVLEFKIPERNHTNF